MKELKLSNTDKVALVDDADYEELLRWKWYIDGKGYPHRAVNATVAPNARRHIYWPIYYEILGRPEKGKYIDHKDRNPLNNQRSNLRFATFSQSQMNVMRTSSTGYRGVRRAWKAKTWYAVISVMGKTKKKYGFKTAKDAAKGYNEMAVELHGEFAVLNQL